MPSRATLIVSAFIMLLATLAGSYALLFRPGATVGLGTGTALVGGPFSLTDHLGKRVTEKDFLGKYMLAFFGYTYCPDVCPTELQVMIAALEQMGPAADKIQPVFVTIDPQRDTPDVMKSYVENFSPRLVGLTGTPEEIAAMAKTFRVFYGKAGQAESPDYLMDHSSIVYLMAPDGRFIKHFTYTTDAAALADGIASAVANKP